MAGYWLVSQETACHGENERPPKENDRPWPEAIGGRAWLSLSISLVFLPKGGICMSFVKVMNKKICLFAFLLAFSCFAGYAQADASDARLYELYPTQNIYTFLKLNTKTGQITQLQYAISANDDRMELNVNSTAFIDESLSEEGRFKLYPTQNIYNFLLLDTLTGRVWQVQWSSIDANRGIIGEIESNPST